MRGRHTIFTLAVYAGLFIWSICSGDYGLTVLLSLYLLITVVIPLLAGWAFERFGIKKISSFVPSEESCVYRVRLSQ